MKKLFYSLIIPLLFYSCDAPKKQTHEKLFSAYSDSIRLYIKKENREKVSDCLKILNYYKEDSLHSRFVSSSFFNDTIKPYNNNYYSGLITQLKAKENPEEWAKKTFNISYDEFDKTTWYRSKLISNYIDENKVNVYAGKKGEFMWFWYTINYTGSDWVFMQTATFIAGDKTLTLNIPSGDRKTDNSGGRVWEWVGYEFKDEALYFFESIDIKTPVKYRLTGRQNNYDGQLSLNNKKGIIQMIEFKRMLETYKYIKSDIEKYESKIIK